MARRAIGIDIGPRRVRAAQVARAGRGFRVERAYTRALDGPADEGGDGAAAALRALLAEAGFRRGVPVSIAIPRGKALFQRLETDLPGIAHVRRVLAFELEDDFPVDAADLVLDICGDMPHPGGTRSTLVAGVERSVLRDAVEGPRAAGIECQIADVAACAALAAITANRACPPDGPFLFLRGDDAGAIIGIAQDDRLIAARELAFPPAAGGNGRDPSRFDAPRLAREIELTWRDVFAAAVPEDAQLIVDGDPEVAAELAAAAPTLLPCPVTTLDPFARLAAPDDTPRDSGLAVAVGLAIRATAEGPSNVNFLAADARRAGEAAGARRAVAALIAILLVMAGVWAGGILARRRALERANRSIDAQMKAAVEAAIPEEAQAVRAMPTQAATAYFGDKLDRLRKEAEAFSAVARPAVSPLRILERIGANTPRGLNILVSEVGIEYPAVRIKGVARSFESVDRLARRLEGVPEFATVTIQDIGGGAAETVPFNLLIELVAR